MFLKRIMKVGLLVLIMILSGCSADEGESSDDSSDDDDDDNDTGGDSDGDTDSDTDGDSDGDTDGDSDGDTDADTDECSNEIEVTYYDFDEADNHPDFHCNMQGQGITYGLVLNTLDADRKPQYNPDTPDQTGGSDPMITSAETFYDWYHDTAANTVSSGVLPLTEISPGLWEYASDDHVIVPGEGAFTTEIHAEFVYEQGQVFSFLGDDDVWVFIDGELVVDIGGLHMDEEGSVDLDTLGLTVGETYMIDMFHAERCYPVSHFKLQTSISCFTPVPPV